MPRVSSPSFRVVVKRKVLRDGTYPVRLSCNWHGQSEIGLGFSLPSPSMFDVVRQRVKRSCPNHSLYNKVIEEKLSIVSNDYLSKLRDGVTVFTSHGLLECLRSEGADVGSDGSLVSSCFERVIAKKSYGTSNYYKVLKNHVIRCYGDVSMVDIVDGEKFLSYLDGLDVVDGTRRTLLTLFNAVWQYNIEKGYLPSTCKFPIGKSVINSYVSESRPYHLNVYQLEVLYNHYLKSVLSLENAIRIGLLRGLDIKNGGTGGNVSLDLDFALSYDEIISRGSMTWAMALYGCMVFLGGASPVDMGKMKVGEGFVEIVKDGKRYWKVSGYRSKTGVRFGRDILINSLTKAFFLPFLETADSRDGYLFNILRISPDDKRDITNKRIERLRMRSFSNLVNPLIKELWPVLNEQIRQENKHRAIPHNLIDEDGRFYSARHSFGTVALSRSSDINALCSQMGRSASGISTYIHALTEDELLIEESNKIGF